MAGKSQKTAELRATGQMSGGQSSGMKPLGVLGKTKSRKGERRMKGRGGRKADSNGGRKMTGKDRRVAEEKALEEEMRAAAAAEDLPEPELIEFEEEVPEQEPQQPQQQGASDMPEWAREVLTKVAESTDKLGKEVVSHQQIIKSHEIRLRDIEQKLGIEPLEEWVLEDDDGEIEELTPTKPEASELPEPELKTDEPEVLESEEADPEEPELKTNEPEEAELDGNSGTGYTGKGWVYFIHDQDGYLDYSHPFYSSLAARHYDRLYEAVPALIKNGVYERTLKPSEVTPDFW